MDKLSIRAIGTNLFGLNKTNRNIAPQNQTNPFGLSFKGNVIQADVFEMSKERQVNKEGLKEKLINKGKTYASAIVGSINTFNDGLKSRFNNVISFGKRITKNVRDFLAQPVDINAGIEKMVDGLKDRFGNPYNPKTLAKKDIGELKDMFIAEINVEKGIA